jgi:hypothetical protein
MSLVGASVQRISFEIMSLLTSNTPKEITIYIECSVIPTRSQPSLDTKSAMFIEDSIAIEIFPSS